MLNQLGTAVTMDGQLWLIDLWDMLQAIKKEGAIFMADLKVQELVMADLGKARMAKGQMGYIMIILQVNIDPL